MPKSRKKETPSVQFIHIPKCAGTSTWKMLADLSGDQVKYHPAHSPIRPRQKDEYIFTILRDPVERLLSVYSYAVHRGDYYLFEKAPYLWGSSLYEFVRYLYSTHDPSFYNCMVQFMDGSFPTNDVGDWREALKRINAKKYDHIGFIDQYDCTLLWLKHLWDRQDYRMPHINKTDKTEKLIANVRSQPHFERAIELIVDANIQDILVYRYLRELTGHCPRSNLY
jgi:hypothetical protein